MAKATQLSSVSLPSWIKLCAVRYLDPHARDPRLLPVSEYPANHPHPQTSQDRPFPSLVFRTASRDHTTHIGGMKSTKFCIVNTQDGLAEVIQTITSQEQATLSMAVEASLLALHIHPEPGCSYIVDLDALGASAFEAREASSAARKAACKAGREQTEQQGGPLPSLRAILEDSSIPKVLFDCRPVCAFLAGQFGVKMRSVEDVQCLEFEGRLNRDGPRGNALRDLRSCLE